MAEESIFDAERGKVDKRLSSFHNKHRNAEGKLREDMMNIFRGIHLWGHAIEFGCKMKALHPGLLAERLYKQRPENRLQSRLLAFIGRKISEVIMNIHFPRRDDLFC